MQKMTALYGPVRAWCFLFVPLHFGTAYRHFFYRAMLCIRGTSHGPVSVSVSVCVCHKSEFY